MKRPEQQLQIAVADFLRLALKPPTLWTAFPAGGGGRVRGAFLKAMGLKAGWPDIVIIHPLPNRCHAGSLVIGIELKSKRGFSSYDQHQTCGYFALAGARYYVARSIDDVARFLVENGIPMSASLRGGAEAGTILVKAIGAL